MTFSLDQGGVVMSIQITPTKSPNTHHIAHIHTTPARVVRGDCVGAELGTLTSIFYTSEVS